MLVRLDSDGEHREFLDPVKVPADTAHELGFIDRETRDKLVAEVRIATRHEMKAAIEALPADEHYVRDKLTNAMHSPRLFAKIANSRNVPFTVQ